MKPAKSAKNWIWQVTKPNVLQIVLLSIINGLIAGGSVLFAVLTSYVIDMATGKMSGNFWVPGVAILALVLFEVFLNYANNILKAWITGKVEVRIKEQFFSMLFRKHWKDVSLFHTGELLNRMYADSANIVTSIVTLIPQLVSMATRLVACFAFLITVNRSFTIAFLAFGLVLLSVSRFYGDRSKKLYKDCQQKSGEGRSFAQEATISWMMIQSFDGADTLVLRLRKLLVRHFEACMRRARWNNIAHAATYLLFSGGYYVGLLWGAAQLANPLSGMTYGSFTAFLQIVSQIRTPFMNMSGILPQYYNMLASAERIMELENLPDEPRLPQLYTAEELYSRLQTIQVADVRFSYDEDKEVLSGANFTLNKGEFVALAGYSGIGKSTLFKLMLGFYPPNMGTLTARLEGETLTLGADTRCLFAYVPQKNMLLSGTIRENIAFCCGDVSEEAIWAAAQVAEVADAIRQLPEGLDTLLGESGAGMSEGQLQRLAIARAVLSGAPILLLDECTASLDESTEERVLRNLRALPNRTCLCISHRPAALDICDRVVRVVDGKIVED